MLCRAGKGRGPKKSTAGGPNLRSAATTSPALAWGPVYAATTPHIVVLCSSTGNGGPGGTFRNAKKPLKSSGAEFMKSR